MGTEKLDLELDFMFLVTPHGLTENWSEIEHVWPLDSLTPAE